MPEVEVLVALLQCKGSKYDKEVDLGKVHKVFITYSPLISEMLADGKIKVNE